MLSNRKLQHCASGQNYGHYHREWYLFNKTLVFPTRVYKYINFHVNYSWNIVLVELFKWHLNFKPRQFVIFYLVQHNYWMYFSLLSRVYLLCLTTYPKYRASSLQERYRNNKKGLPLYFSFCFLNDYFLAIILCLNINKSGSNYFHNSKVHVLMLNDYYY